MSEHILAVKVYLEDTDAQAVVYHANYLKYLERGRSEIMQALGQGLSGTRFDDLRYVVHEMRIKFVRPALLGDELLVRTKVERASDYRLRFDQAVGRAGEPELVTAQVDVVCIDPEGELKELPEGLLPRAD